jgi:hypothetical protein
LFDIPDKLDKLFKIYDANIRVTGVLLCTTGVALGLLIILFDNREVTANNKVYFEQSIPKPYRDGFVIFVIIYLFALYRYTRIKSTRPPEIIKIVCSICKVEMKPFNDLHRCPECGRTLGYI